MFKLCVYCDMVKLGEMKFYYMCVWIYDINVDMKYFESNGFLIVNIGSVGFVKFVYYDIIVFMGCMLEVVEYKLEIDVMFNVIVVVGKIWDGKNFICIMDDFQLFLEMNQFVRRLFMKEVVVVILKEFKDCEFLYVFVGNVDFVVVKYDNEYFVMYGWCLYCGVLLSDGYVEGKNLICGLYDWDYWLDIGISVYENIEWLYKFNFWIKCGKIYVDVDEINVWEKDNF